MDSLDDEDRTLVEREGVVVPLACAGDEVVTGNIDALPLGQSAQRVVELRPVDGLKRLVVVVPGPSAILISSLASPPSTFELSCPTVGTPMIRTQDWYSWKMSNIFS